jgi:cytochrome c oxidase assembly protein subunit 11
MNKSAKRTLKYLSLAVFGMFFFSFALVPLYDVFCEVTGLNGKISQSEEGVSYESNTGRDLTIQFVSHNAEQMPWIFRPSEKNYESKDWKV